jgi:hypothetical protein
VNRIERDNIERNTIGQSDNPTWQEERSDRLTASSFHLVIDRRKEETAPLVQTLLYKKFSRKCGTDHMQYGKVNESIAIDRFTKQTGIAVAECGLFVSLEDGCIGASPDGLVGDNAIVEVKCIPSVKDIGLRAAAVDVKHRRYANFCLRLDDNGQLKLKENHKFRRQIQGQLNITERETCYFIVMSDVNQDIHVEEIYRDRTIWTTEMLPRLLAFYKNCMLPEIVNPRMCRGMQIREIPIGVLRPTRKVRKRTVARKPECSKPKKVRRMQS